mgnify:CR=1 FL=1
MPRQEKPAKMPERMKGISVQNWLLPASRNWDCSISARLALNTGQVNPCEKLIMRLIMFFIVNFSSKKKLKLLEGAKLSNEMQILFEKDRY